MCHVVLMMPVLSLPLFWFLPFTTALILYVIICLIAALVYFAILKAMHKPVAGGREGMLGLWAKVVDVSGSKFMVRVHGEIWQAESDQNLKRGALVRVTGMNGLTLKIKPL